MVKLHGSIKATDVPEDVKLGQQKSRERDETQRDIDADMKRLRTAWEEAGKPAHEALTKTDADGNPSPEFKAATKVAYLVEKGDRAGAKGMIRRAGTLHEGVPVYGEDRVDADAGTVRIVFTYGPKPVKAETPATPAPPEASTGGEGAGNTETSGDETGGDQPRRGRFSGRG